MPHVGSAALLDEVVVLLDSQVFHSADEVVDLVVVLTEALELPHVPQVSAEAVVVGLADEVVALTV